MLDVGDRVEEVAHPEPGRGVRKEQNLAALREAPSFKFVESDLTRADLEPVLAGVDVVYHLAAQAGVRVSWAGGFAAYNANNVMATQRLLDALVGSEVRRFVYASSASVYGNQPRYPASEDHLPRPHSPYGLTKLAGEHRATLYADNDGVPAVSLRYFSVYGRGSGRTWACTASSRRP